MVFALVFVMTACQKENFDELTTQNFTQQATEDNLLNARGGERGNRGKCFEIIFPVTLSFPDGSSEEVADRAAARAAIQAWKAANPEATERPSIAFPYDVTLEDGTVVSLSSQEDLDALKETCEPRNGGNRGRCFSIVFPITIDFPDGTSATVNDKEEAKAAKEAWKEANPEATERPSIALPYDVLLRDSSVLTIATAEDREALRATCGNGRDGDDRDGRGERCFRPVFPLTLSFPDGSTAEVADRMAARTAIREWKAANPEATERPSIAFPYEVELADETIVTVENEEAVAALKEACEAADEN